jgi:predicted Zn-dependent peptidase
LLPVGEKLPDEPEDMICPEPFRQAVMEVAMPTFQLAFKCEPIGKGETSVRSEIIGDLAAEALFGESSPLYLELYNQGLIDTSFGGGFEMADGCAFLTCGGDSHDPEAVRDAILAGAEVLVRQGVSQGDFKRMKRSAMGRRIRDLDSFDSTCFRLCAYHFSEFDYFRFPEIYEAVTVQDIQAFLSETVFRERCALSVIRPVKEENTNE